MEETATAPMLRYDMPAVYINCTVLDPAVLDTARPLYNVHYLNGLTSPRTPNQRKFSKALMHRKIPLPRGWKRRVRWSVPHIVALGHYHLLEQRTFSRRTWSSTPG